MVEAMHLNELSERHRVLDAMRTRRLTVLMWIFAALMVAVFVGPAFTGRHGGSWGKAGIGVGFAAMFGGFALFAKAASRKNTDRLQRALEQPRSVLWMYLQDRKMSGATLYRFVILRPADGSMIMVATSSQDAEQTLATLRAHLPHAIVGYGPQQQASYDAARRAM